MMFHFFSHRVVWLALVVSLGIGTLFAHTMWSMRDDHWAYQLRTNTNLSNTLAKGLEWSLEAVDLSLQKTAAALLETRALEAGTQALPPTMLLDVLWRDMQASHILVLDLQGHVVHWAQGVQSVGNQFISHDFFQAFRTGNHQGVFIGQPTRTLIMGEYVLPVAREVRNRHGLPVGVVVGTLRMQELNAWLSTMDLGEHSGVNVIREDGLILTRFPYLENATPQTLAGSDNLARFLASPQGSFVGVAVIDGVQRLYTYHRVGRFPVVVNVAQSTDTIVQGWVRSAWWLGLFALLLMASCVGLAVMFSRELARRAVIESDLFTEKERMRLTLKSIGDAVVCTDAQGRITYLNPVARRLTGLSTQEVLGQSIEWLHAPHDDAALSSSASPLRQALACGHAVERVRTAVIHRLSGQRLEMEESASPVLSASGGVLGGVVVLRDVTQATAQEAHMRQLAFHDVLTGLPNRLLLQDRAQQAMVHARRTGAMLAVIYLDLDHFKQVNDQWGHRAGDAALVHAVQALQAAVRESDTVCRLGGDEFVVLLPELASQEHLLSIAGKIQQACSEPFVWEGQSHTMHASGGVALFPQHAQSWDALLHCADMAMYAAKQAGRHQIRMYEDAGTSRLLTRIEEPGVA